MLSNLDTISVGTGDGTKDIEQTRQKTSILCNSEPLAASPPASGRVVLLNGFPGVGKYSIGHRLYTLFEPPHVRFVDNHVLIDPAQAIAPGRDNDHKELRRAFRKVAFDALCNISDPGVTIILTACLSSTAEDREVFEEHLQIASCRGIPIYIFNIICAPSEHYFRLSAPERSAGTKTKLLDSRILKAMMSKHRLISLSDLGESHKGDPERKMFELDTSGRSVEETAAEIFATVTQECRGLT